MDFGVFHLKNGSGAISTVKVGETLHTGDMRTIKPEEVISGPMPNGLVDPSCRPCGKIITITRELGVMTINNVEAPLMSYRPATIEEYYT